MMRVKVKTERAGLKLNIQKTKIMASRPITSWKIEGEKMEEVTFYFLSSKLTGDRDCSHEVKRCLLFGTKAMTQFIKSKKHHFSDNGPYDQNYGFSSSHVWM